MKAVIQACLPLLALCVYPLGARAHPARGIVVLLDGSIVFADAGRSVVWRITPAGELQALGPGVHAHWLALAPDGRTVYADHLRYEPQGERFLHGLVRFQSTDGKTTIEDAIAPAEGARGLGCSLFLLADEQLLRWSPGTTSTLTRGPLAPPDPQRDQVLARLENVRSMHAAAARQRGGFLVCADATLLVIDADGRVAQRFELPAPQGGGPAGEPLFARELWGVAPTASDGALVCDPSSRRLWSIAGDGRAEVRHTSEAPWAPVGVTTRGESIVLLESGFKPPAHNLGPRVVELQRDRAPRVLALVPDSEPSRPYR